MRKPHQRKWALTAVAVLAASAGVLVPVMTEAGGPKEHDPNATASVNGGTTAAIAVSITNTSTSGNITAQGVRIYLDSDINVANVVSVTKPAAGTLTPTSTTLAAPTPYIEILSANIQRTKTYTVTVNTKIPCNAQGAVYDWVTDIRQSNDYNGTNNQIPAVSPDPTPARTTVATGCSLAFTTQPKSTTPNTTITGTAFNSAGAPVAVTVLSGGASPSAVTWYSGNVAIVSAPTGVSGTSPRPVTNGVATFGDLQIAAEGTYTLSATSGTMSQTSNEFEIGYGVTVTCDQDGLACTTGTIPGRTGGTSASVTVNDQSNEIKANLSAQFVTNDIDCAGYEEFGDRLFFDTQLISGSLTGLTKTVTVTKPVPAGWPTTDADKWLYQVCFQSRTPFQALPLYTPDAPQALYDNLLQALTVGDFTDDAEPVPEGERVLGDLSAPEYRGLLPQCSLVANVAPCLNGLPTFSTVAGVKYVTFVGIVPAADPTWK